MDQKPVLCPNCGGQLPPDFLVTQADPDAAAVAPFLQVQPADSRYTSRELFSYWCNWADIPLDQDPPLTQRRVSAAAVKLGWVARKSRGYTYYMPPAGSGRKAGRPAGTVKRNDMPRSRRMVVDWLEQLRDTSPRFYRGRHSSQDFYDDFLQWLDTECHKHGRDLNDWRFPASRQQVGRVLSAAGWWSGRDQAHGRYFSPPSS